MKKRWNIWWREKERNDGYSLSWKVTWPRSASRRIGPLSCAASWQLVLQNSDEFCWAALQHIKHAEYEMEGTAEMAMDIPYISGSKNQRTDKFSLRSAICPCCPITPPSCYYGYRNMKAKRRHSHGRDQANSRDPSDPVALFLVISEGEKKNSRLMTLLIWQRMSNHR
jgi:hypothetical protein